MTETRIQEALRLARETKAARTPEQVAAAEEAERTILTKFVCMFAGTEDMAKSNGHQPCFSLSPVEMRRFRETTSATHRWAEWERKILSEAS